MGIVINKKLGTTLRTEKYLSRQELVVLEGLIEGKCNRDIASENGLDQKTISTYKTRIAIKLGLKGVQDGKPECKIISSLDLAIHAVAKGYLPANYFDMKCREALTLLN